MGIINEKEKNSSVGIVEFVKNAFSGDRKRKGHIDTPSEIQRMMSDRARQFKKNK